MARILLVEDDPINAEVALIVCGAAGHVVTLAPNGAEALLRLGAEGFDLVLTDVIMPEMDGITLTARIRASGAPYAGLPIIGLTARAGHEDLQEMREAGMDHVMTKPFRSRALTELVAVALAPADLPVA